MARADIVTWLSLDEWANLVGYNPLNFNNFDSTQLFSPRKAGAVLTQYAWQAGDKLSREDIAYAIHEAERKIAGVVGYNLLPDWTRDERHQTRRPARPDLFSSGINIRGQSKSVTLKNGYYISGGFKQSTLIEAGVAIVRTDSDGDGYSETATVTVATTVTSVDEVKLYYPGESGSPKWEIRPVDISISGGVATCVFKSWQIPDPDALEKVTANLNALNPTLAASYITTVDVYRVYNDPQVQVQFLWEVHTTSDNAVGEFNSQYGVLRGRDYSLSIVSYQPGTWNSVTEQFDYVCYTVNRDPDVLKTWYYSGWQDTSEVMSKSKMDRFWAEAVAYFACAQLRRPLDGTDSVTNFIQRWQVDRSSNPEFGKGYQTTPYDLDNPLGSTTEGARFALARINEEGRRLLR